jgi:hypothetical protein
MAYYILFRQGVLGRPAKCGVKRDVLVHFEEALAANREVAQHDDMNNSSKVDFALLEYDRLNQSPNDASAIEFRVAVLSSFIAAAKASVPPKSKPAK